MILAARPGPSGQLNQFQAGFLSIDLAFDQLQGIVWHKRKTNWATSRTG
jgi:hypothetical protein